MKIEKLGNGAWSLDIDEPALHILSDAKMQELSDVVAEWSRRNETTATREILAEREDQKRQWGDAHDGFPEFHQTIIWSTAFGQIVKSGDLVISIPSMAVAKMSDCEDLLKTAIPVKAQIIPHRTPYDYANAAIIVRQDDMEPFLLSSERFHGAVKVEQLWCAYIGTNMAYKPFTRGEPIGSISMVIDGKQVDMTQDLNWPMSLSDAEAIDEEECGTIVTPLGYNAKVLSDHSKCGAAYLTNPLQKHSNVAPNKLIDGLQLDTAHLIMKEQDTEYRLLEYPTSIPMSVRLRLSMNNQSPFLLADNAIYAKTSNDPVRLRIAYIDGRGHLRESDNLVECDLESVPNIGCNHLSKPIPGDFFINGDDICFVTLPRRKNETLFYRVPKLNMNNIDLNLLDDDYVDYCVNQMETFPVQQMVHRLSLIPKYNSVPVRYATDFFIHDGIVWRNSGTINDNVIATEIAIDGKSLIRLYNYRTIVSTAKLDTAGVMLIDARKSDLIERILADE